MWVQSKATSENNWTACSLSAGFDINILGTRYSYFYHEHWQMELFLKQKQNCRAVWMVGCHLVHYETTNMLTPTTLFQWTVKVLMANSDQDGTLFQNHAHQKQNCRAVWMVGCHLVHYETTNMLTPTTLFQWTVKVLMANSDQDGTLFQNHAHLLFNCKLRKHASYRSKNSVLTFIYTQIPMIVYINSPSSSLTYKAWRHFDHATSMYISKLGDVCDSRQANYNCGWCEMWSCFS